MNPQDEPAAAADQANGTHNADGPAATKRSEDGTPAPRCSRREWFRQIARGAAVAALIGGGAWMGRHAVGGANDKAVRRTLAPCPPETLGFCASCSRRGDCALPGGVDFRAQTGRAQGGGR